VERAKLAAALERVATGCRAAAVAFSDGERFSVNWSALPWKKLGLVGAGGAFAAIAAVIPEPVTVFGIHLQHVLMVAAGILAGWAKRAPGDIKAE
jgi:hypothetical protein